jgi:alkylhydroperoxidase family enzyme
VRLLKRLGCYLRVLPKARRNRTALLRWMVHRPQLLVGMAAGEASVMTSNRLEPRLLSLAEMKAAAMVSCEFCLDIGAAVWRAKGLSEREMLELHRFEESDAYDELDRLVLRYVEAVSSTPVVVDAALRDELVARLGRAAFTDLAYMAAWENKRGRLYLGLGVEPAGFSDGLECAVPNRVGS